MTAFDDLLRTPYGRRRYLLEMDGANRVTGIVKRFYFSDDAFTTLPSDDPRNTYFRPRLNNALVFQRHLYTQNGTVGGRSLPGFGALVLNNGDGSLDELDGYVFQGRRIVVKYGGEKFTYGEFGVVFSGTCDGIDWPDDLTCVVRLRDLSYLLDKPLLTNRYGGTGGTDGPPEMKGVLKPRALGIVKNITPVFLGVVGGLYTWQVNDGPIDDVPNWYDGGVPIARSGDSSPDAGQYYPNLATGIVTAASQPATTVTADVRGDKRGGVFRSKPAELMPEVAATFGGVTLFDAASIADVAALAPWDIGWYSNADQMRVADWMDLAADSFMGWWGFNRPGEFNIGRMKVPAAEPEASYQGREVMEGKLRRLATPVPFSKITIGHSRAWTIQQFGSPDQQPAGLAPGFAEFAGQEWRTATVDRSGTVLPLYPSAIELTVNTLLQSEAHALALGNVVADLYCVPRDVFQATVKTRPFSNDLGHSIRLFDRRYNLSAGRVFRLIGMAEDASISEIDMTLWG